MASKEKIILEIYGISKSIRRATGGKFSVSLNPQNTLLVTDRRILIVTIPMPGVEFEALSYAYAFILRKKIIQKGREMVKSMSPNQIFNSNMSNISINFSDIDGIKFKGLFLKLIGQRRIIIFTKDKKKYSYMIINKQDFARLQEVLATYVN